MNDDETRIAKFFAAYDPKIAKLGKAVRAKLRARLPGLNELVYVYENQDALVFSYSPSEAGADGVCGLALYPNHVHLFLAGGAALSQSDPSKLLQGKAKTVRHVVLGALADFDRAEIEVLIAAALKLSNLRLDAGATGANVIKAEEQKKRARVAKKAARPAGKAPAAKASAAKPPRVRRPSS